MRPSEGSLTLIDPRIPDIEWAGLVVIPSNAAETIERAERTLEADYSTFERAFELLNMAF
jgi:hypothetical protein